MTDSSDTEAGTDVHQELARLQEKLAYYESFDQLIQKSVSDAGDILREAIDMREAASRDIEAASRSADSARLTQLESYRSLFSEMLDDITQLQGHAERLARRLSDAIDSLETQLLPEVEFPNLPTSLTAEMASTIESTPVNDEISVNLTRSDNETTIDDIPGSSQGTTPAIEELADDSRVEAERLLDPIGHSPVVESSTPLPIEALPEGGRPDGRFVLLVHGVPNAAMALSLKSFLEGLEIVERVEPREFAAGLLRLQLDVQRNLHEHDLASWNASKTVQTVHTRPGLLEIKLT